MSVGDASSTTVPVRRWRALVRSFVLAVVLGAIALGLPSLTVASSASRARTTASLGDKEIVVMCDHAITGSSLGLAKPLFVSRVDGVDAVIFARADRYSACLVSGSNTVEGNQPTTFVHLTKGISELESFAAINKIPGRAMDHADTWFVLRAAPGVSTIATASPGRSQASSIRDGFVFVHVRETADVRGKFIYGIATSFSANGMYRGSTTLS